VYGLSIAVLGASLGASLDHFDGRNPNTPIVLKSANCNWVITADRKGHQTVNKELCGTLESITAASLLCRLNYYHVYVFVSFSPSCNICTVFLSTLQMQKLELLWFVIWVSSEQAWLGWPGSRVDLLWHCLFEGLMKGCSAPLRMAWELVSGLPVSRQPSQGRLMYHMRMRGQMGGRERWMERDRKRN